jgi:hypothetical protein
VAHALLFDWGLPWLRELWDESVFRSAGSPETERQHDGRPEGAGVGVNPAARSSRDAVFQRTRQRSVEASLADVSHIIG